MKKLGRSERNVVRLVALVVIAGGVAPTIAPTPLASAVAYDLAALATAVVAFVGARRLPRSRQPEWLFLAAGCFCFFLGHLVWDFYERILDQPAPLPSFADAMYLLAYPLIMVGVLRLVRRRTDTDRLAAWLDVGVLAMAVGLLVWEPLLVDSGRDLAGSLIAGLYPVLDIVILGFAAALAMNRQLAQPMLLILGGAGTLFIADLSFLILEGRGAYSTGDWPDPLFTIGTLLLATAPWFDDPAELPDEARRGRERPVARMMIVVAALAALPVDFGLVPGSTESRDDQIVRMLLRILLLAFVALRLIRQAARNERLLVELDRTSTRLSTVIENTADAVVFVGPTGEILEWNATAETLFGFTRDEVTGTNVLDLFETEANTRTVRELMSSLTAGGSVERTLHLEIRGQPMAVLLQIEAVGDARGAVVGFVTLARDETPRLVASHAVQSFTQLRPDDALAQFGNELQHFVAFDSLSLAIVEQDEFREIARLVSLDEDGDTALRPVPEHDLLRGPLLGPVSMIQDERYLILKGDDFGKYRDDLAQAGIAQSIALPLRHPVNGEIRGLLGVSFNVPGSATRVVAESLAQVAPEVSRSVDNMMLYERERRTAERLQELDDLREGVVELVAHEVRSPLGAISTAAAVLRDHGAEIDSDQARELAAGISASARNLARLTSDLVDASRDGHGTFPCEVIAIDDLAAVVGTAAANAAAGSPTRLRLCTAAGVSVVGDPDRLAQIVANLVTNALKFAPGQIEVLLAAIDENAVVRVIDHGPGVSAEHAHRLFERFTRLPYDGPAPRPGGSGLGLFISRELARAHRGELTHEPTPGGGATFVLRLSLARNRASA